MPHPRVALHTSLGTIVLTLDGDLAPETVDNFLGYAMAGFYDGTIFHRVIADFMIQGGGYTPDLEQKEARAPIHNEATNGLKNDRGTVAMARTSDPHSATAQFFINLVDNDFLNHKAPTAQGWGYTVFGKVTEGADVVEAIGDVDTGGRGPFKSDVPLTTVVIERVECLPD